MDHVRSLFIRQILAIAFIGIIMPVHAQQAPVHTQGKEFWLGFMENGFGAFSLRIQISSEVNTSGTVSIPLMGWSQAFSVTANNVTSVAIPAFAEHSGSEVVTAKGVHILAADTVNVYAVNSQSYTTDVTSVLPINSLGTRYVASAAEGLPGFANFYRSELLIVAVKDGTQIQVTPSVPTSAGAPAGVPFLVNLNAGETYQLHSNLPSSDLTGTDVRGTTASGECRPFAVFSGSMCANVPNTCTACDHLYEQNFPTNTWGTEYKTAPFGGTTHYAYRVIAAQNGTNVTVNGAMLTTLNAGQFIDISGQPQALCINGSAPVAVFQFMQGYTCSGVGDPSMVMLNSVDRPLYNASFSTVTSAQINTHKLSIVTESSNAGNVVLDGTTLSAAGFTAFGSCTNYVYRSVTLTAGQHTVRSTGGILATAYGYGTGESYGYSLGSTKSVLPMSDTLICATGPVTLVAPPQLSNVQWTTTVAPGTVLATGPVYTFNATSTTTYIATGDLYASGCPQQQLYDVEFNAPPTLTVSADDPVICAPGQVQLRMNAVPIPPGMTVSWTPAQLLNDPTLVDPIATVAQSTWFVVQVSTQAGCSYSVDSVQVQVPALPIAELSARVTADTICAGQQTQLSAIVTRTVAFDGFDNGISSSWSTVTGGSSSNNCGSTSGNALYFNGGGLRAATTQALDLSNGGSVHFNLKVATGVAPCDNADPGENIVLEYSTNGGAVWNLINTYNENAYPAFTPVDVTLPAGALTPNTLLRWSQPTHSGAGQDNWAMDNMRVEAVQNSGLQFTWTPAMGLSNANIANPVATPASSGWYRVLVEQTGFNCNKADSVFIEVGPQFTITLPNDTNLCQPDDVQLFANPSAGVGHSWSWTPNNGSLVANNIQAPLANVATNTTYQVNVVSAHGCTANGQVQVNVDQILDMYITATDSSLCLGENAQLTANVVGNPGAMSFAWSPAATLSSNSTQITTATPIDPLTSYSVIVTDVPTGCTYFDTLPVTTLNMFVDAGPDTTLCSAVGYVMPMVHNAPTPTINWSPANFVDDPAIANPTITYDSTATYSVTVSDASGCSITEQVTITVPFSNLPAINDTAFCFGGSSVLDAGYPGGTYQWNTGAQTQMITADTNGTYIVTITEPDAGCQADISTNVIVHDLPIVDLGPDSSLCDGDPLTLNADNVGANFLWNTTAVGQTLQPTNSGAFWAQVTDGNNCVNSDTVNVVFNPVPVIPLADTSACIGETIMLDAGNVGATFLWNNTSANQTISVDSDGTYSVTVTTAAGCSNTGQSVVTFVPYPVVDLGNDTSICANATLDLSANNPGLDVLWSDNSTAPMITVNTPGLHWVQVSNGGCITIDTLMLVIDALPVNNLSDVIGCEGDVITLDAGNPGSTFVWSTTEITQTVQVNAAGMYVVDVTTPNGCSDQFNAQVDLLYYPAVDLGNDTALCEGNVITLDAGNPGISRSWNTGSTDQLIDVTTTGTYSVAVSNANCVSTDSIFVDFRPLPDKITTAQILTCLDEDPHYVVIDAGNPGSQYNWSTGEITQKILAGAYGWYFVSITDNFDCSVSDSVRVVENCPASLWVPNSFTPNGDGVNDVFFAVGNNIAEYQLMIFDRYGELIFTSEKPENAWDGTLNGQIVQDGVYVWRLAYRFFRETGGNGGIGPVMEQMGHVNVLR